MSRYGGEIKRKPVRRPRTGLPNHKRQIAEAFDREALARVCAMSEDDFADAYGMDTYTVAQPAPNDFYHFRDNGAKVLAVAHLDTVGAPHTREAHYVDTEAGTVVYSRALDDRLGAYIILELLPKLGIVVDLLLTTGEESGMSTASAFDAPRDYNWVIEFDRGGTDVVMYQFEDDDTAELVLSAGAPVGEGIFSDICYLEHLECKAFNWGVGYQDYHSDRSHAFLDDTFQMVGHFLNFHDQNADEYLPHDLDDEPTDMWASLTRPGSKSIHSLDDEDWRRYVEEENERMGWLSEQ